MIADQDSSNEIKLFIKNYGNVRDRFKIQFNSDNLQPYIKLERTIFQLDPEAISSFIITIGIPENLNLMQSINAYCTY